MGNNQNLILGVVADDFTGAGDIASFLVAGGLSTVLVNGIPNPGEDFSCFNAVVVALKSRTQETKAAVHDTLCAFDRLREMGAKTLYFKYCSTFDSTPRGNIGPVIDAAMERYSAAFTLLCPSLPINGRTVQDAILYVNGVPLSESHMKNHPLTPMWDSYIPSLMKQQGKYRCYPISAEVLENDNKLKDTLNTILKTESRFYLCPDYWEDRHGRLIAKAFRNLPLLTGGSGLAAELAKVLSCNAPAAEYPVVVNKGPRLILAGSCSAATRSQVDTYIRAGGISMMVSPAKLDTGEQSVNSLNEFLDSHCDQDILLYSSGSAGNKEDVQNGSMASDILEQTFSEIAKHAVKKGCNHLVVAGGETSGAVTQALGYRSFHIGKSIANGVPMMVPTQNTEMVLALKSGNFGEQDFFLTALSTKNDEEK